MKILMINHFPLEGSGSGTYTKNLAVSLTKKGHDVCIIMPENTEEYPLLEGVRLHPVFVQLPVLYISSAQRNDIRGSFAGGNGDVRDGFHEGDR